MAVKLETEEEVILWVRMNGDDKLIKKLAKFFCVLVVGGLLSGCQNGQLSDGAFQASVEAVIASTAVAQNGGSTAVPDATLPALLPPTFTAVPAIEPPVVAETAVFVETAVPMNTRLPTETPFIPTYTPTSRPTVPPPTVTETSPAIPTLSIPTLPPPATPLPTPVLGDDLLRNGDFEGGWYHMQGLPELQLPNRWIFEWDEGPTGFGTDPWDQWIRPETRVLPDLQLPVHERTLFILDGKQTIKIFKGNGSLSFRLYQELPLEAGSYRLTIRAFPDLIMDYDGGQKVWSDDPLAGEIQIIAPNSDAGFLLPSFGTWNTVVRTFTLTEPATVRLGVGIRARFALPNNGWFFDHWELQRIEG